MLNLQRLAIFAAVVEAGSFTAAAAALGQTKAVVSFNVKQLENELGVSLLARSTRRLSLTDAGERFTSAACSCCRRRKTCWTTCAAIIMG
ncbi:LysR family transcriptional regulator [Serratia ureilytica]